MKELRVSFEKFDFNGFVHEMYEFACEIMEPSYAFPWVYKSGDMPEYDEDKDERNLFYELKDEGKQLYFAFSNVGIEESINCADGKEYEIDEDSDFGLGEATVGYLLKFKDGELIINSAMDCAGGCMVPPPSINIVEDCDVFDEPMERFINMFINKQ